MSALINILGDNNKNNKKNKNNAAGKTIVVPKTVQESIPYLSVYPNGIIQTTEDTYTKSYKIEDTNFKTEEQGVQESMFLDYESLLNSLEPNMIGELTIYNRSIDSDDFKNQILFQHKKDELNKFRNEFNEVLTNKMQAGRNNLIKEKYFTVAVTADNIKDAADKFNHVDANVDSIVKRINKKQTPPMTLEQRLNLLYDIYNPNSQYSFSTQIKPILKSGVLNLKSLNGMGKSSKDIIAPNQLSFYKDSIEVGNQVACSVMICNLPTSLSADILADITDLHCNMLTSIYYCPIDNQEATLMVKHRITDIDSNIIEAQKRAAKGNYSSDIIPSELQRAKEQIMELKNDMVGRNQKLFQTTIVCTLFADDKDQLKSYVKTLESLCVGYLCSVKVLGYQQEAGLNTSLPLAQLKIASKRVLTTESSAVFQPFSVQELSQRKGYYYGLNAISKNLILYDRLSSDNYNGLIFGKPGSGKSFIAKLELINTILKTDDDVFVIDPQAEYLPLVEAFNGQRIDIEIGSKTHINPLDMDIQFAGENDNPIAAKCDFLVSICETIIGKENMNPVMVNVIHRCGRRIYKPYYEHMRNSGIVQKGVTCDREAMPTLVDFYQELVNEHDANAQLLASALEMYCMGNYDLFAHKTDINPNSRFVVYNISGMPSGMKELALQIALNDIWNRIIDNHKKGKKTWFYIDEFHLLMKNESSATFVQMIYKMARKLGGIPTGITQNVADVLVSETAGVILQNCNFLLMMNQSQIDRLALAKLFNISETLLEFISDRPAGTGLLYNGAQILPFINEFPAETQLYKIISTKATEDTKEF